MRVPLCGFHDLVTTCEKGHLHYLSFVLASAPVLKVISELEAAAAQLPTEHGSLRQAH